MVTIMPKMIVNSVALTSGLGGGGSYESPQAKMSPNRTAMNHP